MYLIAYTVGDSIPVSKPPLRAVCSGKCSSEYFFTHVCVDVLSFMLNVCNVALCRDILL
jgi:hypothetical protein